MKRIFGLVIPLAFLAAAVSAPALAQEADVPGAPVEEARSFSGAPLGTLEDLAETLGEAHAIRALCNGDGDQTWRNYMFEMMALEAPGGPRRSALTGAFNRGYRRQSGSRTECSPDMVAIEASIASRGRQLAESAAASYLH
jgi:uncharacterized protein (TIGR02301 family)